ncbi:MAG: class I SAM-dependent methyltransferase, partial [Pseudomonadota bacterium]
MAKKPELDAAYTLKDADEARAFYGDWAETYDSSFAASRDYILHEEVAAGFVAAGGTGPVLDVGAGTGLVGEALARRGVSPLEATDLSEEMLAVAERKGCYARVFVADITEAMPIPEGTYGGIVSAGAFTLGHLGPEPIEELIRITRPGGLLALSVNAVHWEAAGFDAAMAALGDRITGLKRAPIRIYAQDASHDHADDLSMLAT